MMILKSIGLFVLKLLLGGLFGKIKNEEAQKARRERDNAIAIANSGQEAKDVEISILEKQHEVERVFKERKLPDGDPFGFEAFNQGA